MWTNENRAKYNRDHLRHPSDLTDDEWAHVDHRCTKWSRLSGSKIADQEEFVAWWKKNVSVRHGGDTKNGSAFLLVPSRPPRRLSPASAMRVGPSKPTMALGSRASVVAR